MQVKERDIPVNDTEHQEIPTPRKRRRGDIAVFAMIPMLAFTGSAAMVALQDLNWVAGAFTIFSAAVTVPVVRRVIENPR